MILNVAAWYQRFLWCIMELVPPDVTTANPLASDSGCLLLKACYLPLNFKGGLRRAFPYFSVFHLIAADKSAATVGEDMIIQAAL